MIEGLRMVISGYLIKSRRGSTSVEAAILTPIIFICILVLIFFSLILYGRCQLQTVADEVSEAGSAVWKNSSAEMETGNLNTAEYANDGLYWRIADAKKPVKLERVEEAVRKRKISGLAVKHENIEPSAVLSNYIVYKELKLHLSQAFNVPIPAAFDVFGISGSHHINTFSRSAINEPAELIRNIDFIADIERELEKSNPAVKNIGSKTREVIVQLKAKIESIFNANGD